LFRIVLEAFTGAVMIFLGILFVIYIPNSPVNFATDIIFLAAGVLIIKRAYDMNQKQKLQALEEARKAKKPKQPQKKKR
jgi:uncharacterized membrane protein